MRHALPAWAAGWLPTWSTQAAMRALRTTIVVPGLFAFAYLVIRDLQLATFVAFGGFATLVLAGFGGTRIDKLVAHLSLAVAGSVLLIIGTAVNGSTVLAVVVTIPVVFAVLFSGVLGPNAASGGTAALLAFVLPAASPGTLAMIPSRMAGWWLASAVGTAAVLLLSPQPPGDRIREAAATSAEAIANLLQRAVDAAEIDDHRDAAVTAKHALFDIFSASPFRPTGMATADQALASMVEALEWATSAALDAVPGEGALANASGVDRDLLIAAARVSRDVAGLLRGARIWPDFEGLEQRKAAAVARLREGVGGRPSEELHLAFHARVVAVAVRTAAAEALIACRRAGPQEVAAVRRHWYGVAGDTAGQDSRHPVLAGIEKLMAGHASLRSVWFVNSLRGAVALAAAIAVADLGNVQHAFWVVLGTLSVLRTNASSTGATALRAIAGTAVGFVVGAALILAVGTNRTALWAVLPAAVLVAAYAPGTAPFAVGQAAFTLVVSVLYNLLVPVGWKVGVVRIEDVAIGCAVSVVVGALFWPRGASRVVREDLADAFSEGARYLTEAVRWALGLREAPPDRAAAAVAAGLRLDEALRGFLAEQGAKHVPKEHLWRLVGAAARLRLTANALAGAHHPDQDGDPDSRTIDERAERLAGWYARLAEVLVRTGAHHEAHPPGLELDGVDAAGNAPDDLRGHPFHHLWVALHIDHLRNHLPDVVGPASEVVALSGRPWWR